MFITSGNYTFKNIINFSIFLGDRFLENQVVVKKNATKLASSKRVVAVEKTDIIFLKI